MEQHIARRARTRAKPREQTSPLSWLTLMFKNSSSLQGHAADSCSTTSVAKSSSAKPPSTPDTITWDRFIPAGFAELCDVSASS